MNAHYRVMHQPDGIFARLSLVSQLDIFGIWLFFFGVLFLAIYGSPFDLPGVQRRNRRRKHVFFGYVGLIAILVGTFYQSGASLYTGLGF